MVNSFVFHLDGPPEPSPIAFGASRLRDALTARGWREGQGTDPGAWRIEARIEMAGKDDPLISEAFRVRSSDADPGHGLTIEGGDETGAMVGLLELAERVRAGEDPRTLAGLEGRPRFAVRALKVNLPWMSYRVHPCIQLHDKASRDLDFYRDLIDHLAECRFNRISLWSLHPWHLMVRSEDFPEACDLSDGELAEWQTFWHGLFGHAHARGIRTQMFFWNIFVSPAFARAHGAATYSIEADYFGEGDQSDLVARYNRSVLTQVLREYPDLDGIGFAPSERMGGMTPAERGEWIDRVLLQAVRDAGRPVEVNYRVPHSGSTHSCGPMNRDTELTGRRQIEAADVPGPLYAEVKYNWSHGHSTPRLCRIHAGATTGALWDPVPDRFRITWMVRNEDFFCLRWCAPSFVRAHLAENDRPWTGGYYTGSECYIPAVNYIDRDPLATGARWGFQRQRLFYLVWGRLLYDPVLTDAGLRRAIDAQYGPGTGKELLPALDRAGQTPLRMATFVGTTWDHMLYSEGWVNREGFISLERLMEAEPLNPAWVGVRAFVELMAAGREPDPGRTTPLQVADSAEADATAALGALDGLPAATGPVAEEIADARVWAHLGLYLADKIRAAVALARWEAGLDPAGADEADRRMERCVGHWDDVIRLTEARFREVPLQHTGDIPFSWARYRPAVLEDLRWVRARRDTPARPASGAGPRRL